MSNKELKKGKARISKASEPKEDYGSKNADKAIRFFSSFEEMEEYGRQRMADNTQEERLRNLEAMRKIFLRQYLLPDGNWPPLARVITIKEPKTE